MNHLEELKEIIKNLTYFSGRFNEDLIEIENLIVEIRELDLSPTSKTELIDYIRANGRYNASSGKMVIYTRHLTQKIESTILPPSNETFALKWYIRGLNTINFAEGSPPIDEQNPNKEILNSFKSQWDG